MSEIENTNKAWWTAKLMTQFGLSKEKSLELLDIVQQLIQEERVKAKEEMIKEFIEKIVDSFLVSDEKIGCYKVLDDYILELTQSLKE